MNKPKHQFFYVTAVFQLLNLGSQRLFRHFFLSRFFVFSDFLASLSSFLFFFFLSSVFCFSFCFLHWFCLVFFFRFIFVVN